MLENETSNNFLSSITKTLNLFSVSFPWFSFSSILCPFYNYCFSYYKWPYFSFYSSPKPPWRNTGKFWVYKKYQGCWKTIKQQQQRKHAFDLDITCFYAVFSTRTEGSLEKKSGYDTTLYWVSWQHWKVIFTMTFLCTKGWISSNCFPMANF